MKKNYPLNFLMVLFVFTTFITQAQTYNLNSGTSVCTNNTGIDNTYVCANTTSTVQLGSFNDTNASSHVLTSMSGTVYIACNGTSQVFLNGVLVATIVTSGTTCSCQSIASTPGITNNFNVTMTPQIAAAYVAGGTNIITFKSTTGTQCCYGADITVTTTLSSDDFEYNNLKIYPNPATDLIQVQGLDTTSSYVIYNLIGSEISKGQISNNDKISVRNLESGVYFLKFETGKTYKFIKE